MWKQETLEVLVLFSFFVGGSSSSGVQEVRKHAA